MSLFVPSQLENNKRVKKIYNKRVNLNPMYELESKNDILLDDSMNKNHTKFPRIIRIERKDE